jgi:chorismate mutase/prephenate dehydratase
MSTLNLSEIRAKIDDIDAQIQALITQRAYLAQEVARAKYAEETQPNFYRPERETEILNNVIARNQSPLPNESMGHLFREIMSACLAIQKPLRVAYLGPEGTYSQAATIKQFGHAVQAVPVQTIDEVFREVAAKAVQYGLVPVENSTEGAVNQTLDCFLNTPLKICGEVALPIHHHLLSHAPNLQAITHIYSHQQSLGQCRAWINANLPHAERIPVSSNAEAARRVMQEPHAAAIAGEIAAELYQLPKLASRIEDNVNNTTRWVVLGQQNVPSTGRDKTALLLATANKPGALHQLLKAFADNQLSLTRIESRPSRQGVWEYVFFIDIEGHIEDIAVKNALKALESHASMIKHLGSYPKAVL